jgi:regulator of PEP synthase PpsR (kinase-PPPase family)
MEVLSIHKVQESDRYIVIERNNSGEIVNINYQQGIVDAWLNDFPINKSHEELTAFILNRATIMSIKQIDGLIWEFRDIGEKTMEKERIIKNNLMIAEFMNYKVPEKALREDPTKPFQVAYHESWDWLIPVIDKLEDKLEDGTDHLGNITHALLDYDIEETYQEVVEAIKFLDK